MNISVDSTAIMFLIDNLLDRFFSILLLRYVIRYMLRYTLRLLWFLSSLSDPKLSRNILHITFRHNFGLSYLPLRTCEPFQLLPFLLQDYFGMRGKLATACSVLTIPVFGILSFTKSVPPLVTMIWLGCTYSVAAVSFASHPFYFRSPFLVYC